MEPVMTEKVEGKYKLSNSTGLCNVRVWNDTWNIFQLSATLMPAHSNNIQFYLHVDIPKKEQEEERLYSSYPLLQT